MPARSPHSLRLFACLLVLPVSLGLRTANSAGREKQTMTDRQPEESAQVVRFARIPPGPVTDKIRVELRLGIENTGAASRTFHVSFFLDRSRKESLIAEQTVTIPPHEKALSRAWWPTTDRVGK